MKMNYQDRRTRLVKQMDQNSVLLLAGNSELERTKDVPYPFRQSNNFLYLTGINIPDAYLVLSGTIQRLYIKKLHPFMEAWEGRVNRLDELKIASGIDEIIEYKDLDDVIASELKGAKQVYLDTPDRLQAQPAAWYLWRQLQDNYPEMEVSSINPIIESLRVIKDTDEIARIKEAIKITHQALNHVQALLEPGVSEQQIAAEFIKFASAQGIEQAFPPIVSFGKNSCVIHHTPDDTLLKAGELVLFDVGLEVDGYASDISRTLKIGEVSDRQHQVHQAVIAAQQEAMEIMKPGIRFDELEEQVAGIMQQKLVDLGLFASLEEATRPEGELQWPAYRRYYNHYVSHFMGLDAHDVGPRDAVLAPGMVMSCEPGIYIAEEGIGVRIEDDILITADGNQNLSAGVVLDNH